MAEAPRRAALAILSTEIASCRACPRLVAWREEVARVRRRAYQGERYWGRGVPGFGDPAARVVLLGLAPGAHGANRTGRMFTGDGSGDFLYAALHRAGLASAPASRAVDDGLVLRRVFVTNACRCVPPGNRPAPDELVRCAPFLDRELAALPRARVVVALGAIAWDAALAHLARRGAAVPRPRPRFAHGAEWFPSVRTECGGRAAAAESRYAPVPELPALLGSYHPSRQNTNTGRLTPAMLDRVLARAVAIAAR